MGTTYLARLRHRWRDRFPGNLRGTVAHAPSDDVALACRILDAEGHDELMSGHVSIRDPHGRGFWTNSAGLGLDEIGTRNILLVDWTGAIVEGDGRQHPEWPIHAEVLSARSELTSVVHSHAPNTVAFGTTGQPLRPVSHAGTKFVPPDVARIATDGDVCTSEAGRRVAEALADRSVLLLVHHGLVACGATVQEAVSNAVLLERAARTQLRVAGSGTRYSWSSDEEALSKRDHCYSSQAMWNYLARRVEQGSLRHSLRRRLGD